MWEATDDQVPGFPEEIYLEALKELEGFFTRMEFLRKSFDYNY